MKFRVRIDEREGLRELLVDYLKDKDHVLVHHELPHGNPHYHYYVDLPVVNSVSAYKYKLKKLFAVEGSQFSCKECNEERVNEYKQYLFNRKHDNKPTLVSATGEVANFVELANQVAIEFEETKTKKKQITSWQIVMMLRERVNKYEELDDHEYMEQIVADAIDIHNELHKTFCDFSLVRIIQTAISTTKYKKHVISKVVNKTFCLD